jgi:hypothetical protein
LSRSLNTQKLEARAQRRTARPYGKRRDEAEYIRGRADAELLAPIRRPVIRIQKPAPGMRQPLTRRQIQLHLEAVGPQYYYGLRRITCRHESAITPDGIVFGEYIVPGEIWLYSVPEGPWPLPFLLYDSDCVTFGRYGAQIQADRDRGRTVVSWAADDLARFMLREVLFHELGHHRLQYHKGKRSAVVCRRSDHERCADLHARRIYRVVAFAADCPAATEARLIDMAMPQGQGPAG